MNKEYKPDVAAVVIAMTDNEQPFLYTALEAVFADPCIAQVVLCVESANNWLDSTLAEFAKDPRLEIIRLPLASPGAVRNHALKYVRTTWVAFCDGDDMWCKKGKMQQREYADKVGCDFVGSDHYLTDETGKIRAFALARYMPMLSSWMVRTEVMRKYPFDETMLTDEDGVWWFDTESRIRKARYPNMLLKYRVRYNSLSSLTDTKKKKAKIVALASKPVIGLAVYLLTASLWLLTRRKQYLWHKNWSKRPV